MTFSRAVVLSAVLMGALALVIGWLLNGVVWGIALFAAAVGVGLLLGRSSGPGRVE
jgi:hypothetical protein